MSDLISRQKVSDIIKTRLYQTALNNTECITSYDKVCEDIAENRIDTWINEAKSVDPEKCGDCISREAATDRFDLVQSDDKCMGYDDIMAFLSSLPSVEPERKMGKWIDISSDDDMEEFYCCSLCKREIILYPGETLKDYPYCHCGARMEVDG